MRKLNVDFTQADKPKEVVVQDKALAWASPVGWWKISTEGDCEGRTTTELGEHYGHVVDIALELANKSSWKLTFSKSTRTNLRKQTETKRIATKREVHLTFSGGPFDVQYPDVKNIHNWLATDGILVTRSNLYGAIHIEAPKYV